MQEKHAQWVVIIDDTESADEDVDFRTTNILPASTRKRRPPLTSEDCPPQTAEGAKKQDDDEDDAHEGLTFKRHKLPEPREEHARAQPPAMPLQQMQQVSAETFNQFSSDQLRSMGLSLKPVEELEKIWKAASADKASLEAAVVATGADCKSYRQQLTLNSSTVVDATTRMMQGSVAQTLGDDDTAAGFVAITTELCRKAHEQVKVNEDMLLNSAPYTDMAREHAKLEGSFHRSLGRQEV
eukprot:gene6534-6760_t